MKKINNTDINRASVNTENKSNLKVASSISGEILAGVFAVIPRNLQITELTIIATSIPPMNRNRLIPKITEMNSPINKTIA